MAYCLRHRWSDGSRMSMSPVGNHTRGDIAWVTERRSLTRAAVGAPSSAGVSDMVSLVGTSAWMSRGVVGGDALFNDCFPHFVV
jgi:hypothetical protein